MPITICSIHIGSSIFTATNDMKTAPQFKQHHDDGNITHYGHAEMRALQTVGKHRDVSNARVYVHRILNNGSISMAKPCVHCQAMLWRSGVKARRVWYTNSDGVWERMTS